MDKQRIKGRENYPTKEIDPKNFLEDDEILDMMKGIDKLNLNQGDFSKIYNCVDCGECNTEEHRIALKRRFIQQGFTFEGLKDMITCFNKYRTPYPTNKMRIKRPDAIPEDSETLFFMGCLSTIRIPHYTEHALDYLLQNKVDFTILDEEICCGWPWHISGVTQEYEICKKENVEIFENYKRIICLCPACYYLFKEEYSNQFKNEIEIKYISDYLQPSKAIKSGRVGVQHLCQLKFRGREGVEKLVDKLLAKSGYAVENIPHWCCGGGIGYMHRTDVIDEIAKKRMSDFDIQNLDYITTYCVSCWWILERFSKICKIHPKPKDIFELLM
jgi:Fe-S oxidoreductase